MIFRIREIERFLFHFVTLLVSAGFMPAGRHLSATSHRARRFSLRCVRLGFAEPHASQKVFCGGADV